MNTLEQLIDQIKGLSDSDLLEAAIYYFSEKFDVSSREEIQNALSAFCMENQADFSELMSIESRLERDRKSYRSLLQFLLINEAQTGDMELQKVQEAVNSVGQKQVITETGLAIVLATLATLVLSGYALELTGGKIKVSTKKTHEVKPDGTVVDTTTKEEFFIDPLSPVGSLFNFFKNITKK